MSNYEKKGEKIKSGKTSTGFEILEVEKRSNPGESFLTLLYLNDTYFPKTRGFEGLLYGIP